MVIDPNRKSFGRIRATPLFQKQKKQQETTHLEKNYPQLGSHYSLKYSPPLLVDDFVVSVSEIQIRLLEAGISKSKDSIQRYCREGFLSCRKLGMMRKYYATEDSVSALVFNLQQDAGAENGMQLHEGASSNIQLEKQNSDAENQDPEPERIQPHAPADSGRQVHESALSPNLEEFYRGQIRTKDEQIAAMLERDRETNILIRDLQGLVSKTMNLLSSSTSGDRDRFKD